MRKRTEKEILYQSRDRLRTKRRRIWTRHDGAPPADERAYVEGIWYVATCGCGARRSKRQQYHGVRWLCAACCSVSAGRCMCNPIFAHTGLYCDELRRNSWALGAILVLVSFVSVMLLASAAKKVSKTPSRCGSGLAQLATMLCWQKGEGKEVQSCIANTRVS